MRPGQAAGPPGNEFPGYLSSSLTGRREAFHPGGVTPGSQGIHSLASALHLGFVSARSAFFEEGSGTLWADAGLGRLVDALGRRCERLTLALSAAPVHRPLFDHALTVRGEDFLPLPFLPSFKGGFFKAAACRRVIRAVEARSDALIVQLPFAAPLALAGARRPRLYHVCADVLAQVSTSPFYRGPRRWPALAMARFADGWQRRLMHRPGNRAVTHGRRLLEHFGSPPGRWVVSSSLLEEEIGSVARRRPAGPPWRVLFVGYLRHEKGFDVLLDAFERLLAEVPEAQLEVVGGADTGDSGEALGRRLEELAAGGRLRLAGEKGFGPELFQHFADADVLVLPSRSEGTPRVLLEARAFGCPVVASRVGGVPSSVDDGVDGLLVPPGDAGALAAALLRLAREPELDRRLVAAGFERARRHTVERFADELMAEAALLVAPNSLGRASTSPEQRRSETSCGL